MNQLKDLEMIVLDFLLYRNRMGNVSHMKQNNILSSNITNLIEDTSNDKSFSYEISSDINKKFAPIVEMVLDDNEYEGSSLYNDILHREFIAQLVDKVIEKAKNTFNDIEEIVLEVDTFAHGIWNRYKLLRAFVESCILHEIFVNRRPIYKNCD